MSRAVEYVHSGGATVAVDATRERTVFEVPQGEVLVTVESIDWIIPVSALAVEPKRGDRVREIVGTLTYVFEVMGELGIPPWHWCDASFTGWRVHCKLVATEAA